MYEAATNGHLEAVKSCYSAKMYANQSLVCVFAIKVNKISESMSIIACNPSFAKSVKDAFEANGVSIAEWARSEGFSAALVYQVLAGRRKCVRGQCHQIAVALALKDGQRLSAEELVARLSNRQAKQP